VNVDLYTLCWNDGVRLDFFFRHYDPIVNRYFVYDDGSDEATLSILRQHPRVTVRKFQRTHLESFVLSQKALSDECWKESRGQADWVIVTDIDEHLWHKNVHDYLAHCKQAGVTAIPALGFQMITSLFPAADTLLCEQITSGVPWSYMMKLSIFDPNAVDEINFSPGRHKAQPTGHIIYPAKDEMLLLHYKYLGIQETFSRHCSEANGLRETDLIMGWGHQYVWKFEEFMNSWNSFLTQATDYRVYAHDDKAIFPVPKWWLKSIEPQPLTSISKPNPVGSSGLA
jgi:Glycosyl transferase family 2